MPYQREKSDLVLNYIIFFTFFAGYIAGIVLIIFLIIPLVFASQSPVNVPINQFNPIQGSSPNLQPTITGKSLQGSN